MKNGHGAYDFSEDDDRTEATAERIVAKYKNPNLDDSAILKYNLLECVTQVNHVQEKGINSVICVNVDAVDCDPACESEDDERPEANTHLEANTEDCASRAPHLNATSCEQIPDLKKENYGSRSFFPELASRDSCSEAQLPGKSQLNCGTSESLSNNEPVAGNSDVDESMDEDSPLSPASDAVEDSASLNGYVSDHCFDDLEMDDINMAVVIHPDYVVYRDNICSGTMVTFSCASIKVEDSTACGSLGTFNFERGIKDIIDIKCQWFQRIGSVIVKLRVLSRDAVRDDDTEGTSGIEELEFAVVEHNWSEKQEKITLLNAKYKDIWSIVVVHLMEMDGDNSFQRRQYFPNFDEPFEDVVYPKGDSDAVSLGKRDVDLLQPETFINDTIIDFYIKYLKNQIAAEEKHRFHFFNSFFFRKLADLDKDPSSISDGKAAFLRVRKWTRKVDIFGKDYIFIPVNFNLHWSLIIICHLGEVVAFNDEDLDMSERVPCILHMDSIKGTHAGLKNLVQSYLWEEWKERHKDSSEDISSKFLNMRFVPLELPQQENSFDCGLFLLHYLELFLAVAPVNFSPFKLTKFSNFLNVDWFPPGEASLKRTLIQKLIFELLEVRSHEAKSAVCHDEHQSSRFQDNNEIETGMDLSQNGPAIAQHGNVSNSQPTRGVEITLLGTTSARNLPCVNDSGLVLREFFESGATAGSLLAQYQSFGQPSSYYHLNGTISMREEDDDETSEEFVYLPSGENGFQQITELTAQASTNPYSSRGFETATSWNPAIPMQREHDIDASSETSLCASDDSGEVGIIENSPLAEDGSQSLKERTNHSSPSLNNIGYLTEDLASVSNKMLQISTFQGSEEPDKMDLSNENIDLPCCQENLTTLLQDRNFVENKLHQDSEMVENRLHQDTEMDENREFACDDVQVLGDDLQVESYEQQAGKGLQFNTLEEEQGFTGSLSKDLHL